MKSSKMMRWVGFLLSVIIVIMALKMTAGYGLEKEKFVEIEGYERWDADLLAEFGSLPVQDGGRIKPFSTWAGFELLRLNGKRSIKFTSKGKKVKITPTEWAMDCFFRPELAEQMEFFQIGNSDVMAMLDKERLEKAKLEKLKSGGEFDEEALKKEVAKQFGETFGKKRRDRYSFDSFEESILELDLLARKLVKKQEGLELEGKKLETQEEQFVAFVSKVRKYVVLHSHFAPMRTRVAEANDANMVNEDDFSKMSTMVKRWEIIKGHLVSENQAGRKLSPVMEERLRDLFGRASFRAYSDIAMMPPANIEDTWVKRENWIDQYLKGEVKYDAEQIRYLEEMEKLVLAFGEEGQKGLLEAVFEFKKVMAPMLKDTDVVAKLESEISYYDKDYFTYGFVLSIIGFLVVALGWTGPGTGFAKLCNLGAWFLLGGAFIYTVWGITHRSILMERPPVGNLYDTISFIVAVTFVVLGVIELLTKRTVGLGLALFLGVLGLGLAMMYEAGEAKDHMDPLVAVLRSNYWLTIHVLTIVMGYAGGLLTAGLAHVYLFARWFGIDEGDKKFRRLMTRLTYGGVCFTLFFSLVGTVLGGVWANDSWGRFWGWDPKENGALMIVLWTLIILHARLGGYLREWGMHICGVLTAPLVVFSWWHVNFLGVGLHNYGFSGSKGLQAVWSFYYMEIFIVLIASGCVIYEQISSKDKKLRSSKGEPEVI